MLRIVTVTPGRSPPDLSVTLPLIVPVTVWARSGETRRTRNSPINTERSRIQCLLGYFALGRSWTRFDKQPTRDRTHGSATEDTGTCARASRSRCAVGSHCARVGSYAASGRRAFKAAEPPTEFSGGRQAAVRSDQPEVRAREACDRSRCLLHRPSVGRVAPSYADAIDSPAA